MDYRSPTSLAADTLTICGVPTKDHHAGGIPTGTYDHCIEQFTVSPTLRGDTLVWVATALFPVVHCIPYVCVLAAPAFLPNFPGAFSPFPSFAGISRFIWKNASLIRFWFTLSDTDCPPLRFVEVPAPQNPLVLISFWGLYCPQFPPYDATCLAALRTSSVTLASVRIEANML